MQTAATGQTVSVVNAYIATVAWCAAHFVMFLATRHKLNAEKAIFVFHATAFTIFFLAVCFAWFNGSLPLPTTTGMMSLHGIYSLTFLWLWSGSEGSYSASILRRLAAAPVSGVHLADALSRIGNRKQSDRIRSLLDLGLVVRAGDSFHLTAPGRLAASALATLRWLANLRTAG